MGGNTRDKIREVALALFAKNGYDATSMEQIAAGVGIKKSSLYAFIDSKEGLYLEIYEGLESEYRNFMEQVLVASEGMAPLERLHYLFKEYIIYVGQAMGEAGAFYRRVLFFPPTALKDKLLTRVSGNEKNLGEKLREIIRYGMQQGLIREASPDEMLLSYYSLREGLAALMIVFMQDVTADQKFAKIDRVWQDYCWGITKC